MSNENTPATADAVLTEEGLSPAVTQAGGGLSPPVAFNREPLTNDELAKLAAVIDSKLVWTFNEEAKSYTGTADFGVATLTRRDDGHLYIEFSNTAHLEGRTGGFTSLMPMGDARGVADAKEMFPRRLAEAYNQSFRNDPLLAKPEAEPDLI